MGDIFQDIDSNIIIVKDRNGAVYWPNLNAQGDYLNTIGDIKQGNGYIVNTNLSIDLNISGLTLSTTPHDYPIHVPSGWSFIGYLHDQTSNGVENMLISIQDNLIILKDSIGNVYWPDYGVDEIKSLSPGQGYQVKLSAASTLIYPDL